MAKVKKTFDRELMYKKIMPTNLKKNSEQDTEDTEDTGNDTNREKISQNEKSILINTDNIYIYENPMPTKNTDLAEDIIKEDIEDKNGIVDNKNLASQNNSTNLNEEKNSGIILCNIMEKLVLEKLDIALKKMNCCKCERCREDIIALALNSLKPMYVVATKDELNNKVEEQDKLGLEVTTAVLKAVLNIRKNPRH